MCINDHTPLQWVIIHGHAYDVWWHLFIPKIQRLYQCIQWHFNSLCVVIHRWCQLLLQQRLSCSDVIITPPFRVICNHAWLVILPLIIHCCATYLCTCYKLQFHHNGFSLTVWTCICISLCVYILQFCMYNMILQYNSHLHSSYMNELTIVIIICMTDILLAV